jgi:hypothetical protein
LFLVNRGYALQNHRTGRGEAGWGKFRAGAYNKKLIEQQALVVFHNLISFVPFFKAHLMPTLQSWAP